MTDLSNKELIIISITAIILTFFLYIAFETDFSAISRTMDMDRITNQCYVECRAYHGNNETCFDYCMDYMTMMTQGGE